MNPIFTPLLESLQNAAKATGFDLKMDQIHLDKTKTLEHGHFASNLAMILSKQAGKNPREVAQSIVDGLESGFIERAEVAGPGFINLFIEQKFYTENCHQILRKSELLLKIGEKKTMVIDTSHPNIAKPMGVHHLLSTVIGESIKHIYRQRGWEVIGDNYLGDMGTQFGKLMHAIKKWGNQEEIERDPITELQKLYVKFHSEAEEDESLDDEGRAEYRRFEEGDEEARKMWKKIREWSLAEIQPIYDRLGVQFDVMNGESFYEDKMYPVLEKGREEGVIVDGEGGSWIIPVEDPEGTPVLLRKSDGATLYATRDVARTKYWEDTWHPDLMVNVVDQAQEFYFKQLFYAQEKLGLTQASNIHVSFGRMSFKDGKMSTRKGNIILLNEVLDEAEQRALKLVKEKAQDLNESEERELARKVGVNSVKYSILSPNRNTNIVFDWDKMLSFEGNSAPYLMYTLARAKSVLRKSEMSVEHILAYSLESETDAEVQLMIQLMMYPDVLSRASEEFKPNHVANYLYQLAQDYNHFYNGNSILQAESEPLKKSRLLMTATMVQVMELGFETLGLEGLERM